MSEKDIKIEQNMNVVDKILNTVKTGNLRLNAPELASLVFLKFTSDNAEMLCVEIDSSLCSTRWLFFLAREPVFFICRWVLYFREEKCRKFGRFLFGTDTFMQ